jgi:hypothetical protein
VPLSEHEQRMLEQIESALYAEDPKFASQVRGARTRASSSRRRLQVIAVFLLGLVLLVAGLALPIKLGAFPIISLVGFIVMFAAGVWGLLGKSTRPAAGAAGAAGSTGRRAPNARPGGRPASGSLAKRMEERFRKRFEQ